MPAVDIAFTADARLFKAFVGDDGKTRYVVVKASDNGIDLQRDMLSAEVFEAVIKDAKEGKIILCSSHFTPFGFGKSVDAWTKVEDDGLVSLYIMFMLKDNYGESDDLFNAIMNNQGDMYQASIGGKVKDYIYKSDRKHGMVRVITKAEVNHVAVTWKGMAVNPRTGFVQAILKAIYDWEQLQKQQPFSIGYWVQEEDGMQKTKGDRRDDEEGQRREEVISFDDTTPAAGDVDKKPPLSDKPSLRRKATLKKAIEMLDRLEAERRQLNFTAEDLEKQVERSKEYGISPSPLGFAVKPPIFAGIPDENFVDPVNYIFPVQSAEDVETYLQLWDQKPLLFKSIYPDTESLRRVLSKICLKAKELGVPIPPHSSVIWFVDTETAKLVTDGAINEELHKHIVSSLETADSVQEGLMTGHIHFDIEKARDEQAERKLRERARKYGYEPAPNAHLTKPAEYSHIPDSQFADPVGYNYPIDREHVLAAIRYFLKPKNRNVYTPKAQKIVYERILRAMKRFGHKHRFDPDNPLDWLMPQSLKRWMVGYEKYEDEDTAEKREEMERQLEREYKEHNKGKKQLRKSFVEFPYSNVLYQILDEGLEALADLFRREELHKYYIAPNGYLTTPDEGYSADDYADPVSFLYPVTNAEEVSQSLEEFLANRKHYPPHAQLFIYRRLLQKAKEFNQVKEFDQDNPLDWIVAAEDSELLAKARVDQDKAAEAETQLQKEYVDHAKNSGLEPALQIMEIMKALIVRQSPDYLMKVLESTAAPDFPSRPWVIGEDGKSRRAVGLPPLVYICQFAKFPKGHSKYPVTDMSQPIAAITKNAIELLAKKFQLGGKDEVKIKKADDGKVEIDLVRNERVLRKFILHEDNDEFVLSQVVEVTAKPMILRKDDLAHLSLVEAIRGSAKRDRVGVLAIGTAYAAVTDEDGVALVPYWITPDGEIRVEWEARVPAMEIFIPEGRDSEEQVLTVIYNALRERASEDWRNFVESLITEAEGMVEEEGIPNDEEEKEK